MHVLLTAGPTYEPIDPVRFIGNHSTGKMGYALAETFAENGFQVTLVSGPTNLSISHPAVQVVRVQTAQEMYEAAAAVAPAADVWVFAAAVADYRPRTVAAEKIKKRDDGTDETLTIELVKNVDIAATLGQTKRPEQFSVGFALETQDELLNAQGKLRRKRFDLVVLNSLRDAGAGFRHDTNKITLVEADRVTTFDLKPKADVARDIVSAILARLQPHVA
ncbi:phosphopantothenoylcysteine decarboxylase [Hymenobacter sp. CRA2]|uniref:phosphopantothenoylcysteine decarboxylase domain-containing protein n=1 Tax=Hymenobacter sp. CRA2 TaxID=1955620 RepID=UPI0009900612|nr:phosphopantothenoylcysteine decarboxylase [Hymenobacter sp. CRA2]OON65886.1 phosphopantothenoylcysteine decarboxylase [Hymenobacter sp. CRA2]